MSTRSTAAQKYLGNGKPLRPPSAPGGVARDGSHGWTDDGVVNDEPDTTPPRDSITFVSDGDALAWP